MATIGLDRDNDFDIAEEVARGLLQRSNDEIYPTHPDVTTNGSDGGVLGSSYCSLLSDGSACDFPDHIVTNGFENTLSAFSMSSSTALRPMNLYQQGNVEERGSKVKRSVGRKPPKGPDGVRRYSSRRATVERRDRINLRERERMHQLCDAFERLRHVLPFKRQKPGVHRQRLSKISTLLLAQNYIRALEEMLEQPLDDVTAVGPAVSTGGGYTSTAASGIHMHEGFPAEYYPCAGELNGYTRQVGLEQQHDAHGGFSQDCYGANATQYHYL